MTKIHYTAPMLVALALLTACGNSDDIQPGPRYTLDGAGNINAAAQSAQIETAQLIQPSTESWSQYLGNMQNHAPNAYFSNASTPVAKVDLGTDGRRAIYGASAPIIVGRTLYHYSADGRVSALSENGQIFWQKSLTPTGERSDDGFGGGLAYAQERLYSASGFGKIHALSPENGTILWRHDLKAPTRGAPLVTDGLLILSVNANDLIALDAKTGVERWRYFGLGGNQPSRLGVAVPAGGNGRIYHASASGSLVALDAKTGQLAWSHTSINDFFSGSKSLVSDGSASPVLIGNTLYVGTRSGVGAFDATNGAKIWSANIGTKGPIVISGNSVYGMTTTGKLWRIHAQNGQVLFVKDLAKLNKERKHKVKSYLDPRLVNNQIWVGDNRGYIEHFDATTGAPLGLADMKTAFSVAPVFGSGLMATVSEKGDLLIYR